MMRRFLWALFLVGAVSGQVMAQGDPHWTWGGEMDPLQKKFEVRHYSLEVEILPAIKGINASMEMLFEPIGELDTLRLDLIMNYRVWKVEAEGEEVAFSHHDDLLDIYLTGAAKRVKVYYRGKPPVAENPPWSGGFTWEEDGNGNHWVGLSCQHEGAKIFMPCLDHPASEATNGVDLYIKAPFPYFVAANGRLLNQASGLGYNYFHWATAYPVNNYNINFTMGRLYEKGQSFTSVSGQEVPMKVYVLEENRVKASSLMDVLETSVRTQEKFFGAFPFGDDKIAVVETPYLGMEHQTINAYGNNFQFQEVGGKPFDWLLYHELGHEWWGNKLSVKDWADFWMHEGFCSYGDLLYYLEHGGEEAYQERVRQLARNVKNEKPLVLEENASAAEAYHPDIYTKGAIVLHSLRFLLGDDVFFPMLKDFVGNEAFSYNNRVRTGDFIAFVEDYTERELSSFFEVYLYSADVPEVKIKSKGRKKYEVFFRKANLSLPIEIQTSEGLELVQVSKTPVRLKSDDMIVVDPNGWYLLEK
ncbi:M1 family metallopeptidase [Echinicola sediminis]